jgi:hypothetical protein
VGTTALKGVFAVWGLAIMLWLMLLLLLLLLLLMVMTMIMMMMIMMMMMMMPLLLLMLAVAAAAVGSDSWRQLWVLLLRMLLWVLVRRGSALTCNDALACTDAHEILYMMPLGYAHVVVFHSTSPSPPACVVWCIYSCIVGGGGKGWVQMKEIIFGANKTKSITSEVLH